MATLNKAEKFSMGFVKVLVGFAGVIVIALLLFGKKTKNPNAEAQTQPAPTHQCLICGKTLTDYRWIETSVGHYMCTLCYDKTQRDIKDEMKAEGYDVK